MKHLYSFSAIIIVAILLGVVVLRMVKNQTGFLFLSNTAAIPAPVTSSYQIGGLAVTKPLPTLAPFTPAAASTAETSNVAVDSRPAAPGLEEFASALANGKEQLVGVYVPGLFALPVVQQPQSRPDFVSTNDNEITEFSLPKKFGSTGLLAHNYLSGEAFYNLKAGQEIILVYGNGKAAAYRVNRVEQYQALTPESPLSEFVDLTNPDGDHLTSSQLFHRVYGKAKQVVFQTCIEAFGDPSWGRIFIIADLVSAIQPIPMPIQPSLN